MMNPRRGSVWGRFGGAPYAVIVEARPYVHTRSAVEAEYIITNSRRGDWSWYRMGGFFHGSGWVYMGTIGRMTAGLRVLSNPS